MPIPSSTTSSPATGTLYSRSGARKYLSAVERAQFIAATASLPLLQATICQTLAYTGCRLSEALMITTRSVDVAGGFIQLRTLKRRHGAVAYREIPVPSSLVDQFIRCGCLDPCDRRIWTWSRGYAWRVVKDAMIAAHIGAGKHRTAKALRHSFGLHAVRCGIPVTMVQRWLGHAQLRTTAIYLQAIGPEEREMAMRMW